MLGRTGCWIKLWTQLNFFTDITWFYYDVLNKKGIIQRTEGEYKQRETYCYFKKLFVSEVFINNLNSALKSCFELKSVKLLLALDCMFLSCHVRVSV